MHGKWAVGVAVYALLLLATVIIGCSRGEAQPPRTIEKDTKTMTKNSNQAYETKTANGGRYIDGVPTLKWGQWKDSSYCGSVAALLNTAGVSVSYEDVMGWSGVCYQALMCNDWDPSSQMPQNGLLCEKNVGDALGISVYTLQDENGIREQATKSIDNGIPVLLVGGRWAPEWTLACGYAVENGDVKFFGRTYFDCQNHNVSEKVIEGQSTNVPGNEIYTENAYFYLNGFPGWFPGALTRFYDRTCEPISRKQALKVSLEICIKMFEQPPGEHHRFGYDAYDVLISGFELDEADYQAKCTCDQYHIGSMQDARRAAYIYLESSAGLLGGGNREKLGEVAKLYKKMLDNLFAAVPYDETSPIFNTKTTVMNNTFNATQRRALADALTANKQLEKQARVIVTDILASWEK